MGMEIKIKVGDMLNVLVNAGIDGTDAKAIIFDLLQYPEDGNVPERRKLKDAKKNRIKNKRIVEDEYEDEDEDEDEDDEEDEEDLTVTKIKRPKRISFKNFGGASLTPQPQKKV